jgi:hypothetical protein
VHGTVELEAVLVAVLLKLELVEVLVLEDGVENEEVLGVETLLQNPGFVGQALYSWIDGFQVLRTTHAPFESAHQPSVFRVVSPRQSHLHVVGLNSPYKQKPGDGVWHCEQAETPVVDVAMVKDELVEDVLVDVVVDNVLGETIDVVVLEAELGEGSGTDPH